MDQRLDKDSELLLDALRGLAAFVVLFAHGFELAAGSAFGWHTPNTEGWRWARAILGNADWCVWGFFVISGICIHRSIARGVASGKFNWWRYGLARVTRLYPLFLIGFALAIIAWSFGLDFAVTPAVLIPRYDSEVLIEAALAAGIAVRGAMSCTVGCPYEGEIAPERVEMVARLMHGIGVQHVGVADTIGVGTPHKVQKALEATLKVYGIDHISGHFHDTYGMALANTLASLQMGIWNYDTSVAGLGGCPYAKGATGNVASEDVVYLLHGMGIETGIDLDKLVDAGKFISDFLQRKPNSRADNSTILPSIVATRPAWS